jgi:hypothetical protein
VACCCEHSNEHSDSVKDEEFVEKLRFSKICILHGGSYCYY